MNRWNSFLAVCGYLRAGLLGGPPPAATAPVRWDRLIEASSRHLVTPALAWCLRNEADIPPEIGDYFAAALALNGRRNAILLEGLARTVAALNAIDIEPVLLKGAARLFDQTYPAPSLRLLGDLDVLIPRDRATAAATALKNIGFDTAADIPDEPMHYHHLPMMCERETGIGVELHTELTRPPNDRIFSAAWFEQKTRPIHFRNLRLRMGDATRIIAHNIVHDQLHHANYRARRCTLRQLLDLAVVRAKNEGAIDWAELDRLFCSVGQGKVIATYLEFANRLFGQAPPALSHAPRVGALAAFRVMIEHPALRASTVLGRWSIRTIAVRCRDPRKALDLISPRAWQRRARLIKGALDQADWR